MREFKSHNVMHTKGGSRIFMEGGGGGAQRFCSSTHITSAKLRVPYSWVRGPGGWNLQGFRCFLVLSEPYCISILIQNRIERLIVDQNSRRGAECLLRTPRGSASCIQVVLLTLHHF